MGSEIDIDVFYLNCNGLNDKLKRNAVFSRLKRSAKGLYLLQETHSTMESERLWRNEWGSDSVYFSHGKSNSKGVAILISKDYEAKIINMQRDSEGRILVIDVERHGSIYTIANYYAPTRNFGKEQESFFWNCAKW